MFVYIIETEHGKRMGGFNSTGKRVSALKATSFFADILKGLDTRGYPKEMTICYEGKDIKYSLVERDIGDDPLKEP